MNPRAGSPSVVTPGTTREIIPGPASLTALGSERAARRTAVFRGKGLAAEVWGAVMFLIESGVCMLAGSGRSRK